MLGESAFNNWGWRVPFLIGSVFLTLTLLMRMTMAETFPTSLANRGGIGVIFCLVKEYPKILAAVVSQIAFGTIAIYICTYMNIYLTKSFNLPREVSLTATAAAGFCIGLGSVTGEPLRIYMDLVG